jgi:uncharacterized protein with von Willebrand factor type A (vWA) domain
MQFYPPLYFEGSEFNSLKQLATGAGFVPRIGETRNAYKMLVRKPEDKRPLGRPRRRREDIRMDVRKIGREGVDWIRLAQDRDQWRAPVNTVMNRRVP